MEFQIIGTAEDFSDRAALHGVDKRRAFPEVKPQNAVAKVSDGFIARGNGKSLGHRAVSQAGKLGKYEPHPVALLTTGSQFCKDDRVNRRLRIEETL